jgi:hypothetical protein
MVDIQKRVIGNIQSARAELSEAITLVDNGDYAKANLALAQAARDIRKSFGGIADCTLNDYEADNDVAPPWWKNDP